MATDEGRMVLIPPDNPIEALAELGSELGIHYPPGHLEQLRAEWD